MSATVDILATLTHDQAQQYVGTVFHLIHEGAPVLELKLHDVAVLLGNRQRSSRQKRDPFALYFTAPPPLLAQGIYKLAGEPVTFETLFIVPLSRNEDGTYEYEAVFT
jgi:hypothetical protein